MGVASQKPHPSSEVLGISKRDAVMVTAVECVRSEGRERERREMREERERRRKENRAVLVNQLNEMGLLERKERSKARKIVLACFCLCEYYRLS